ncbi:hypothetical protein [Maridesulfovibrio sp.]|uniref:hypothetical protein n=1 Tax=Maridesulfovibrio sp. TaxID=2795000 RepID=UPI003B008BE8
MIKTNSIGTSVRQKDGPARVTGSAKYYADFIFPGMLQIRILRSPTPLPISYPSTPARPRKWKAYIWS